MNPGEILAPMAVAALLFAPAIEAAELYRWTDERGRVHVTDDLGRVPPQYREKALLDPPQAASPAEPAAPSPTAAPAEEEGETEGNAPPKPRPRRHFIRVEKAGLEILVGGVVNGRLPVPFKVDTGAMINTIPPGVAESLGAALDDPSRQTVVMGIGGEPKLVPVVTLRQVEIGGARVENVDAAVLDTLEVGLLGMPFFRHFRVDLDPTRGLLTLEEVDLSKVEGLYGGWPESYWRTSFRMVQTQLRAVRAYRERIPETFEEVHARLDAAEQYWLSEGDRIEVEASRAGVPRAWRE